MDASYENPITGGLRKPVLLKGSLRDEEGTKEIIVGEKWLPDEHLGEELRRVIENYEVETGREVHAVNLEREPITSVGRPRKRSRILEVLAVVKRPAD